MAPPRRESVHRLTSAVSKERYVQVKVNQRCHGDRIQFVIQIIDFSLDILNRELLKENKLENVIRGWVCHEINNSLNSSEGSIGLISLSIDQLISISSKMKRDEFEQKKTEIEEEVADLVKHVEILGASSRLMRNHVRDLLDF